MNVFGFFLVMLVMLGSAVGAVAVIGALVWLGYRGVLLIRDRRQPLVELAGKPFAPAPLQLQRCYHGRAEPVLVTDEPRPGEESLDFTSKIIGYVCTECYEVVPDPNPFGAFHAGPPVTEDPFEVVHAGPADWEDPFEEVHAGPAVREDIDWFESWTAGESVANVIDKGQFVVLTDGLGRTIAKRDKYFPIPRYEDGTCDSN